MRTLVGWSAAATLLFAVVGLWWGPSSAVPYVWEKPALYGEPPFVGLLQYSVLDALEHASRWGDGVLARPDTLFFSVPAVVALRQSALLPQETLRIVACLSMALAVGILARWSGRYTAVAFLALPCVTFYAVVGYAVAGTLLAVTLFTVVVGRTVQLYERNLGVWVWLTAVVATQQYAPARLYVVGVLGALLPFYWREKMRLDFWGVLLATLGVCVLRYEQLPWFFHARGEQFFSMVTAGTVGAFFHTHPQSWGEVLWAYVSTTVPQTVSVLSTSAIPADWWRGDPPWTAGLMWTWAVGLYGLGVVAAPSNMRRVLGAGMLCVLLGVLLSSRADLHRLSVLAVPLAVLTGCGWGRIHFAWGTLWRNG